MVLKECARDDSFYMPPEWVKQDRVWMIWPERTDNWRLFAKPAQQVHLLLAKNIRIFAEVVVCVSPEQYGYAQKCFHKTGIHLLRLSSDDAWIRDTGPTFVVNNKGKIKGISWGFNSWGGLKGGLYSSWILDNKVPSKILESENIPFCNLNNFILEGGSFHVDGEGTLITTSECLLNRNRNPDLSRKEIERILCLNLGVRKIIWLPYGLFADETDGHVDNLCCFIRPRTLLLAWSDLQQDPNYSICRAAMRILLDSTDAKGRSFIVHKLPIPPPMYATPGEREGIIQSSESISRKRFDRLSGSYINFLMINGGLILPAFGVPTDLVVRDILQKILPDYKIIMIYSREFLLGGGNIHCLTQQQPSSTL